MPIRIARTETAIARGRYLQDIRQRKPDLPRADV